MGTNINTVLVGTGFEPGLMLIMFLRALSSRNRKFSLVQVKVEEEWEGSMLTK